jgi:hypothetical protein
MEAAGTSGKPMHPNQTVRRHVTEEHYLHCGIKLQTTVKSHFIKVSHNLFVFGTTTEVAQMATD